MSSGAPNEDSLRYDPETDTYRATFDSTIRAPSAAVVESVAAILGRDPSALDPLADAVDPDALDVLLAGRRGDGDVVLEFTYLSHAVTVRSIGRIEVRPRAAVDAGPDE